MTYCAYSFVIAIAIVIPSSTSILGQHRTVPIPDRARGAERVVVATIAEVQPRFTRNEFGDELIVSRVKLAVSENLKGTPAAQIYVDVEGGTVGDVTLTVSDLPEMRLGRRGVFFLTRGADGMSRPHLRGLGIVELDRNDRALGEALTLSDIRGLVRRSAR